MIQFQKGEKFNHSRVKINVQTFLEKKRIKMENEVCLYKRTIEKQLRSFDFVQNSRKLERRIKFSSEVVCLHRKYKFV